MKAAVYLTNNKCNSLPQGKQNLEWVRYINPMATTKFIYTSPCSVHGLKNHRN